MHLNPPPLPHTYPIHTHPPRPNAASPPHPYLAPPRFYMLTTWAVSRLLRVRDMREAGAVMLLLLGLRVARERLSV